jgi:hypothetical protein
MTCLSALSNAPLRRIALHCCVLLTVTGGAALAQTTGTVNPGPAPAEPAAKADVPLGGCMPIGLTASGEIVFPIQCKEFIDRERGKTVEQTPPPAAGKPVTADEKPAAEPKPAVAQEKPAARELEAGAPPRDGTPGISKPADKPAEATAMPRRAEREPHTRAPRSEGCSHYRTYDAASGTYRGYDGRRRSC